MTYLELTRIESGPSGTIGVMTIDKQIACITLEPPWRNNERKISCVQAGQYAYQEYISEKFERQCIALHGIHNRKYIAIHPGNALEDTRGCICPGLSVSFGHQRRVIDSNKALDRIIANTGDHGIITIRNCF